MVGFSPMTASANSEDAVSATPPPQQFKAAPPGPVSHPGTPSGSPLKPPRERPPAPRAELPPEPDSRVTPVGLSISPAGAVRCKRRSQLSRDRTPVRSFRPCRAAPTVLLHSRPCRYGEGDMHAIAEGCYPPAGGMRSEQPSKSPFKTGQHQGCCRCW